MLLLASLSFVTCGGPEGRSCASVDCLPGAWLRIQELSSPAGLDGATVTACRNDQCRVAALPPVPASSGDAATVQFPNTDMVVGTLWRTAGDLVRLEIEWREEGPVMDGDHYVVILTDVAGNASTLLDGYATYNDVSPNGEDCAPTCRIAELSS
jgi:hypothetical protein